MVFWIAVAALAAAVTYYVTRPLLGQRATEAIGPDVDVAVYKDQLAEIDGEVARGVLSESDAEAARIEIKRRLLRCAEAVPQASQAVPAEASKPIFLAASLIIPVATLALYLTFGAPGLPGQPLEARLSAPPEKATATDLIAKVEARLREHPEDGRGWDVIAPVYASQGQFAEAAEAYANAMKTLGETPKRLEGFAIAQIRAGNGMVSQEARKALERSLAIDPKRMDARMWLALAKEQDGKIDDAIADYRALIAEAPERAPWRQALEGRIAELEKGAKASDAAQSQAAQAPQSGGALSGMKAEERALVEDMVSGLAARLKANGNDLPGWLKLARAYKVMGRDKDAADAVTEARKQFASDAEALNRIEAAAKELGLGS